MSNVNMQNLFSLLIFSSLVEGIRSDWDYVTEQRKIASRLSREDNFKESQDETVITSTTTAITMDDEKFDDYELKKLFVQHYKLYGHLEGEKYKSKTSQMMNLGRRSRAAEYHTDSVECHSCHAFGTSKSDKRCYTGNKAPIKKCADAEYCFTEVHPEYLRRGCILPGRVNRTFVCKCPFCNDKPSTESVHYEYTSLNDWAFDNVRLARRLLGMDLMCKVCETRGLDSASDQNCRSGKSSEYMVCPHNQICYTNIDDETDFVSRGCINIPAFNSIYFFCNNSRCNKNAFLRPKLRIQGEELRLKIPNAVLKAYSEERTSQGPKSQNAELILLFMFITLGILCNIIILDSIY